MDVIINEDAADKLLQENTALKYRLKTLREMVDDRDIKINSLETKVENLEYDLKGWKEKYEELEQNLQDNYVPRFRDKYEEYGVSREDFC